MGSRDVSFFCVFRLVCAVAPTTNSWYNSNSTFADGLEFMSDSDSVFIFDLESLQIMARLAAMATMTMVMR